MSETLAQAVRARREELHLTLADVASRGGPSSATLSRIESGTTGASSSTRRKLDAALNWPSGTTSKLLGDADGAGDEEPTGALAEAVRNRRKELGLTHAEVASKGGPSGPTMTKIESGETKVSPSSLAKLDTALHWPKGHAAQLIESGEEAPAAPGARPRAGARAIPRPRATAASPATTKGQLAQDVVEEATSFAAKLEVDEDGASLELLAVSDDSGEAGTPESVATAAQHVLDTADEDSLRSYVWSWSGRPFPGVGPVTLRLDIATGPPMAAGVRLLVGEDALAASK